MSQEAGHGDCTPLCTSAMPRALVAWSLSPARAQVYSQRVVWWMWEGLVCRRRARGGIATGHRVVPMSGYVIDLWSSRPQMWKRGLERPARCAKRLEVGACGSWASHG